MTDHDSNFDSEFGILLAWFDTVSFMYADVWKLLAVAQYIWVVVYLRNYWLALHSIWIQICRDFQTGFSVSRCLAFTFIFLFQNH